MVAALSNMARGINKHVLDSCWHFFIFTLVSFANHLSGKRCACQRGGSFV